MRTTLTIDDDVLEAARDLAVSQNRSLGEVISALTREALRPRTAPSFTPSGVPHLPVRPDATPVTLDMVNRLRDETPG